VRRFAGRAGDHLANGIIHKNGGGIVNCGLFLWRAWSGTCLYAAYSDEQLAQVIQFLNNPDGSRGDLLLLLMLLVPHTESFDLRREGYWVLHRGGAKTEYIHHHRSRVGMFWSQR
jgi:hypothetical protein